MPVVAVLPVKSFRLGKQRMAAALAPETRTRLGMALAERTAEVAVAAGMVPLLVAGDAEVGEWAVRLGFPVVPDPGTGLNDAAAAGMSWAEESGSTWLVLHSDLPLLTAGELEPLVAAVKAGTWAIAPSADGGTSAVGGPSALRFAYGPASFIRHLARLAELPVTVVARLGLLHDVDSPGDLDSAARHPRGAWLRRFLR